ncbi:MAG TPA: tetratricopeptide repeat protein, partial [Rhizomicrobium sp.]
GKLLKPAQDAMQANDFVKALELIKQAQALPDLTPFDTYKVNEFAGNAYIHQNDHVNADIAFEAMANSPVLDQLTPEEKANALRIAALLASEQKHYAEGVKFAKAFIALGGAPDPLVLSSLAQAYYYSNDYANAEATANQIIAATPAGQAPNRTGLEILFGAQLKANRQDLAMKTLEQIVTYYDDPDNWAQVIDMGLGTKGIKDFEALHIYRLRLLAKATGRPDDYKVASSLALSLSYPVEAEAILQAGGAPVGAEVRARAAQDRKTVDSFVGIAQKAPTGELDLKAAETLYGYGRYADAEAAARRALQKGGAKMNANEANMVLGQALLRQGKTAEAVAAFNALSNPSPGAAKSQYLWMLYANRKYAAAAPAP